MNHLTEIFPKQSGSGGRAPAHLRLYWLLFSASVSMFVLAFLTGGQAPWLSALFAIGSSVSCGLAWLFSRALFRPGADKELWPAAVVLTLFGLIMVLEGLEYAGLEDNIGARIVLNVVRLMSSAVLLLALLEPLDGFRTADRPERRGRLIYLAGYSLLLFLGVILVRSETGLIGEAQIEPLRVTLCLSALILGAAAYAFRLRHPLPHPATGRRQSRVGDVDADPRLTTKVKALLEDQNIYRDPELRLAHMADRLKVPAYKISQSITAGLGFENFNQLVNAYRTAEAAERLSNPANPEPSILEVAFDCGFASLGPFNRAFKARYGMTPSAYRQDKMRELNPSDA